MDVDEQMSKARHKLAEWLRQQAVPDEYNSLGSFSWRVNRAAPHFGVRTEYPVCLNEKGEIVGACPAWDEVSADFSSRSPTYDECVEMGLQPIFVFDVAVQHKGHISGVFLITPPNKHSKHAVEYARQVCKVADISRLFVYRCNWINSQDRSPVQIRCKAYTTTGVITDGRKTHL